MKAKKVKEETKPEESKHVVVSPFRDINDFNKLYNEGEDVSHFSSERLSKLVESGLVKSSLK